MTTLPFLAFCVAYGLACATFGWMLTRPIISATPPPKCNDSIFEP